MYTTTLGVDTSSLSQTTFSYDRPLSNTFTVTTIDSNTQQSDNDKFTTKIYPKPTDRTEAFQGTAPTRDKPTNDKFLPPNNIPMDNGSGRYPPKDRYPEKYPDKNRPSDSNRPNYTPTDWSSSNPGYGDQDRPQYLGNRDPLNDRFNHYPDYNYPDYPVPYEKNYPMPNKDRFPNEYGQNSAPSVPYRPSTSNGYEYSKPTINDNNYYFYYGNGDRYGQGNGYDNVGNGYSNRPSDSPNYTNRPTSFQGSHNNQPSTNMNGYGQRPISSSNNGYGSQPEKPEASSQRPFGSENSYNTPPLNYNNNQSSSSDGGYNLRPDSQTNSYGSQPDKTTLRPTYPNSGMNGNNYQVTKEPIEIYFNPESYYHNKRNFFIFIK